jgi:hypothetical protein
MANALVTVTLSGLWLFPLCAISWVYHKFLFIWAAIILFMIFYSVLYTTIPNVEEKLAGNSKNKRQ